jgi:hypothetical protein
MRCYLTFGFVCLALTGISYRLFYNHTPWNPNIDWLIALGATTFIVYGIDKLLSKAGRGRCPEIVLISGL